MASLFTIKIYDHPDFADFMFDHPYPTFNEIKSRLTFRLDLLYNSSNHTRCEKIYNNINKPEIIFQILGHIHLTDGMLGVIGCMDIIQFYSSFENYDVVERFAEIVHNFTYRG